MICGRVSRVGILWGETKHRQRPKQPHPAIRDVCACSIRGHAEKIEADIAAAIKAHGVKAGWTARSLALHTQAVLQGAFILAKATGGPKVAAESIDHLRRYIELLFNRPQKKS